MDRYCSEFDFRYNTRHINASQCLQLALSRSEGRLKYADLILIDPRGCGLSPRAEARHCMMDESVNDIEALRQKLDDLKLTDDEQRITKKYEDCVTYQFFVTPISISKQTYEYLTIEKIRNDTGLNPQTREKLFKKNYKPAFAMVADMEDTIKLIRLERMRKEGLPVALLGPRKLT